MDRRRFLCLAALAPLGACAARFEPATKADVDALAAQLVALSSEVDPEEAQQAARLAYARTEELRVAYQITDPPLVHNAKVNMGLRPRGLCWQWADDLESALRAAKFRSFALHRAIANATTIRIDHSTVIISARGQGMFDGIVLDPWRKGGMLTWVATTQDPEYKWVPRAKVFADRAARERLKNY